MKKEINELKDENKKIKDEIQELINNKKEKKEEQKDKTLIIKIYLLFLKILKYHRIIKLLNWKKYIRNFLINNEYKIKIWYIDNYDSWTTIQFMII